MGKPLRLPALGSSTPQTHISGTLLGYRAIPTMFLSHSSIFPLLKAVFQRYWTANSSRASSSPALPRVSPALYGFHAPYLISSCALFNLRSTTGTTDSFLTFQVLVSALRLSPLYLYTNNLGKRLHQHFRTSPGFIARSLC